jgi:predicted dehydrogenase
MQLRDVRLGVIGWGYWGPKLARNLENLPGVKVTMVADLDERRLQFLEILQGIDATTRPEEVLYSDVDGVIIASPVCTHYQLAREALARGKHVLVEKPLTTSVEEAEHLVELADQRGLTLMVGHTFEYSPAINELKRLIDRGDLGKIYCIQMERMNLGRVRTDIDVIWDLAPHDISILLYVLGKKPEAVHVHTHAHVQSHLAEVAHLDLIFAEELYAHIHLSWLYPRKTRKMTVIGDLRSVIYDDTNPAPIQVYDSGVYMDANQCIAYRTGAIHVPHIDGTEPLRLECEDFVRALRTGQCPRASGDKGLEVVRVLAEVQAARSHQGAASVCSG